MNKMFFVFLYRPIPKTLMKMVTLCHIYYLKLVKSMLNFWLPVISYPGHFVPTLVISYLLFGHFVPSNNHFVPRSFRTHFGHFVPRSTGYEMIIWWSIRTQVISYPFDHFIPMFVISYPAKMDGLTNGRTGVF